MTPTPPYPPALQRAVDSLHELDRPSVEKALTETREGSVCNYMVSAKDLAFVMEVLGAPVGATTIKDWRRKRRFMKGI